MSKDALPWILGAALVVIAVALALWLTAPVENLLPGEYDGVM